MKYLAGGKMGDFIHMMFVCEYLFRSTGEKADVYLSNNGDTFEYGVGTAYEDLKPIMEAQPFINTFKIYEGESVDVDLNKFRQSPHLYQQNWLEIYSNTFLNGASIPAEYSWIDIPKQSKYANSLMINRSITNNVIDANTMAGYQTLIQEGNFDAVYFVCFDEKQFESFPIKEGVTLLKVDTLYDFFVKIRSCRFFAGNQSGPFAWASSMNVPRALELHPTTDRVHYIGDKLYYRNFYTLDTITKDSRYFMQSNISLLVGLKNNLDYNKHFYETTRALYPDVELCFVSYGSTDGTHEWLDSLADNNLNYIYSNENKTFSDTFNKAAEIATKDYVAYLHNDIVLAPGFLENLAKHVSPTRVVSYTTIEPPIFAGHPRPGKIIHDLGDSLESFKLNELYTFVSDQQATYRDKIEPGITFFMCAPRKVLLEIGGMDSLFNPMFCEDDDIVRRYELLGMECFTSLDAICYHFVSKTSRFSEEYQNRTMQIEDMSRRNFARKWGSYTKSPKYNIAFVMSKATLQMVHLLEPWCDRLYIDDDMGVIQSHYLDKEQANTKYDLTKRVLTTSFNHPQGENDIVVTFDATNLTNESLTVLVNLAKIIEESGEVGEFEVDCFHILINNMQTHEKDLIVCNSF